MSGILSTQTKQVTVDVNKATVKCLAFKVFLTDQLHSALLLKCAREVRPHRHGDDLHGLGLEVVSSNKVFATHDSGSTTV